MATNRTAAGASLGPLGDQFGQAAAIDKLHRKIILPLNLPHVVDVDDVRVMEPGGGFRLALEAADHLGRGEVAGQDHFHGDRAIEPFLPGLVDHAHSTAADFAEQPVRAKVPRQLAQPRHRAVGVAAERRRLRAGGASTSSASMQSSADASSGCSRKIVARSGRSPAWSRAR